MTSLANDASFDPSSMSLDKKGQKKKATKVKNSKRLYNNECIQGELSEIMNSLNIMDPQNNLQKHRETPRSTNLNVFSNT